MSKKYRNFVAMMVLFVVILAATALRAGETENHSTRIIQAPGKVTIDGKVDDWDL